MGKDDTGSTPVKVNSSFPDATPELKRAMLAGLVVPRDAVSREEARAAKNPGQGQAR